MVKAAIKVGDPGYCRLFLSIVCGIQQAYVAAQG